jgi:pilus assembly protein Flp/PilA
VIVADVVKEKIFVEIHLLRIFSRLVKGEEGVTAVEYTLIASLIAVAAIVAMSHVGNKVDQPRTTAVPPSISAT